MTFRLAFRSLASSPVRSAVLACGFGLGITAMAGLLGVGEVVLEQARAPALSGGGDVVIGGAAGRITSARFVLSHVLTTEPLAGRWTAASPTSTASLYLHGEDGAVRVHARGGIPRLEEALGDPETAGIAGWTDAPGDEAWIAPDPAELLREMDRFHPVPDVPEWAGSWAEWLYFNGRAGPVRFYLTFLAGSHTDGGRRTAGVLLQLDRDGRRTTWAARDEIDETELLAHAPDLSIGGCTVRLEGLTYRIHLEMFQASPAGGTGSRGGRGTPLVADIDIEAPPGNSFPPLTVHGARGWVSGYVVPVLSGRLGGTIRVGAETLPLDGGVGYHDHNWGFWRDVRWQWGQVSGEGLSFVYGRLFPPEDAADPTRLPGFLGLTRPDGAVAVSTTVSIEETDEPSSTTPRQIRITAGGPSMDLTMIFLVDDVLRTPLGDGPLGGTGMTFLQMRGRYRVSGSTGTVPVDFTAAGTAETFRGR